MPSRSKSRPLRGKHRDHDHPAVSLKEHAPQDARALTRARSLKAALGRAGRWMLAAVVLCLALVGFLHLTRGTAVQHVRGVAADGVPIGVGEPQFALAVTMTTGASMAPGNRVEVMLNGDGTYARLWADLRSAQQSITLQLYYGAPSHMADTLSDILRDRAKAGVRVFVLYDAFGTVDIPTDHRAALRASGIIVEPFRPIRLSTLHLAQNRSHVRGIVIDSRVGWTGGFGIDDKWLGDGRSNGSWRETNVRFEGPAVRQLQAAFAAAWVEATGVMFTGRATLEAQPDAVTAAGLLYTAPTLGSTAAERFFALSIAAARKTLYITNSYFAPDRNFIDLLAAAAQRGVDVRILTAGPRTDVNIVRLAGRAWYETLLGSGVRVYEWQPTTLHAKTFVIDGEWFTVGSMNFDNRSMALNDEATLMVLDRTLGDEMNRIFLEDLRHAQEITVEAFRVRSWLQRIAERSANWLTRLL
jgi:cardiolipin synthase A/B